MLTILKVSVHAFHQVGGNHFLSVPYIFWRYNYFIMIKCEIDDVRSEVLTAAKVNGIFLGCQQ